MKNGSAGSAIKGIGVLSSPLPSEEQPASGISSNESAGIEVMTSKDRSSERAVHGGHRRSPIKLAVFTVSRDQRLSRWDLLGCRSGSSVILPQVSQTSSRKTAKCSVNDDDGGGCGSGSADGVKVCYAPNRSNRGAHHKGNCASVTDESCVCVHYDDSGDDSYSGDDADGLSTVEPQAAVLSSSGIYAGEGGGGQCQKKMGPTCSSKWRLLWRAGCVTDVCDVSGLDVIALPPESGSRQPPTRLSSTTTDEHCACCNSLKKPQDSTEGVAAESYTMEGVDGKHGNTFQAAESNTMREEGGIFTGIRSKSRTAVSPAAALVAVSGQGLQLVLFGAV